MRNTFSRTIKFHGYVSQHVRGEGTIASHCWREAETIKLNKEARPSRVRRSGLGWRGSLISFYCSSCLERHIVSNLIFFAENKLIVSANQVFAILISI